jgi:hypothetical protein
MEISILTICTGKYTLFFENFYKSCEEFFLKEHKKKYYVFTDGQISQYENVFRIEQPKLGWPYDTMMRFEMFNSISDKLVGSDYTFFFNANILFIDKIGEEILPNSENDFLMGVEHPGYFQELTVNYPYERRYESNFYIPYDSGKTYFQGCFNGGKTSDFLEMSNELATKIQSDMGLGIIPLWHDESALNWYYSKRNPLKLSPSYAYPESWDMNIEKKIIQIDKNKLGGHSYLRS